jgi:hypothetical protein
MNDVITHADREATTATPLAQPIELQEIALREEQISICICSTDFN